MHLPILFTVLFFLTLLQLATASGKDELRFCREAFWECDFQFEGFEGSLPTFPIGGPADTPFTTRIVSKDPTETLGVLNSNGITPEVIIPDGDVFPITLFGEPPYTPTHVKPFPIADGGSGIGHQTFTGNQLSMARGQCLRVFFSSYQLIVGPHPKDVRNINAEKEDLKCVVFLTEEH